MEQALVALLQEALDHQAEAFDSQEDVDEVELLDWFADWRRKIRAGLIGG